MLLLACFVLGAVFVAGFWGCEQPNAKKARGGGGGEENPELDSNELENYPRAVIDDAGEQLMKFAIVSTAPLAPSYTARGNRGAQELIIQPKPKSDGATVVVKIDGELWGTYKKAAWTWPVAVTPETEPEPEGGGLEDGTGPVGIEETGGLETSPSETERTNRLPLASVYIIEMTVSGATNPIKRVYTYTVSPYVAAEDGTATQQGLVSGRVTGNFTTAFLGTIYTGPDGLLYGLREVQAVNSSGIVVGSTTMQGGVMSGRYFKLPIMGQNSSVLNGVTFRAVFTKTNLAPHYSYPPVALKEFAATAAGATTDKPFEHYIFPEEVSYAKAGSLAAHGGTWLVNGMDFEVPEQGTITSVTLDAAIAQPDVKIALFRNARAGNQAMKLYEKTVTIGAGGAADPQNTFEVNWDVLKGDKVGVLSASTGYVYVNPRGNTNTTILIDTGNACTAATNIAAVGVGYTFKPLVKDDKNYQFMELPVINAAIPAGGPDSYLGKSAETILREIGVPNSIFSLKANYMLMQDVHLAQGDWVPMGRQGQNAAFNGRFYGNGHTISNLRLKRADTISGENIVGFFGSIVGRLEYTAWIYDVNFVVDTSQELITGGTTAGTYFGILGRSERAGIKNVHVRGDVPGRPLTIRHDDPVVAWIRAGGLVGIFYPNTNQADSVMTESSNSLDIFLKYGRITTGAEENSCLGGLVGYAGGGNVNNEINGYIKDSYNDGNITLHFTGGYTSTAANNSRHSVQVGGIVGRAHNNYIYIENCYSTGKVMAIHGTMQPDGTMDTDGAGASFLGGIVGYDTSVTVPGTTIPNVKYTYAAGSIIQKGRLSKGPNLLTRDNSFAGGISGYNNTTNHAVYNALFMPNILYPPYGSDATYAYRQRVARAQDSASPENKAYGAMVIDLYTNSANIAVSGATRPPGVLNPAGNAVFAKAHGASTDFAEFQDKGRYQLLGWRFSDNAEPATNGEPVTPGKHWHWKMAGGTGYPFPLLWWQAKYIGAKTGVSPDTGAQYQWWETSLPAIHETWPQHADWNASELSLALEHPAL